MLTSQHLKVINIRILYITYVIKDSEMNLVKVSRFNYSKF